MGWNWEENCMLTCSIVVDTLRYKRIITRIYLRWKKNEWEVVGDEDLLCQRRVDRMKGKQWCHHYYTWLRLLKKRAEFDQIESLEGRKDEGQIKDAGIIDKNSIYQYTWLRWQTYHWLWVDLFQLLDELDPFEIVSLLVSHTNQPSHHISENKVYRPYLIIYRTWVRMRNTRKMWILRRRWRISRDNYRLSIEERIFWNGQRIEDKVDESEEWKWNE